MNATTGIDHAALHVAMLSQDADDVIAIAQKPLLERLRRLAGNPDALMDLWWTATGDDWPVPVWLPGLFLQAVTAEITKDTP